MIDITGLICSMVVNHAAREEEEAEDEAKKRLDVETDVEQKKHRIMYMKRDIGVTMDID